MKQWSVRLTSAARQDLKDIGGYIKYNLREPETSKKTVRTLRTEIKKLNELPEHCELVQMEPWTSRGVRKLIIGNFVALYVVIPDRSAVSVIRVAHGSRDIESVLREAEGSTDWV